MLICFGQTVNFILILMIITMIKLIIMESLEN